MTRERWRQIEELYHAASERNPSERSAFLDEACRGDQELRAELELLLAQEDSPEALLDRPVWEASGYSSASIAMGTELSGYRIESLLGEGGMGSVYRATDTKLNRTVAVKVLSGALADATARRRFQREAQTASALNHPHILTVHDAGELDSRQYLVTEFVDGGTLRDWARAERRGWRQIVELLVGVADGLATAHEAGVLHRDVKPENILVAKNGYAKLADFGLAKLTDGSGRKVTRTVTEQGTRPGLAIGTLAYMSPEQAEGKPLDARSDIFSFGAVLYEMLADRRPFSGSSDLQAMQNIVHGMPPPLPPEIPGALRGLVEKALEKDPAHRCQSMRDVVVDLRRLTRQSGEPPAPVTPAGRAIRWAFVAATVLVLIAAIAAWKFWPRASSHPVRSIAVLPLRNVSRDPDQQYFADGMTDALTTGLSQVSALSVIARTSAMRYQGTQKTAPEIARELHVDAVVEGAVQRSGNRVLITVELVDGSNDHNLWAKSYQRDAGDALGLQNEVAQAIASEIQVKLTPQEQAHLAPPRPVNPEAQEAYLRGVYWDDKGEEGKAFDHFLDATKKDPSYAAAYAALSIAYGYAIDGGLMSDKEGYPKWRAAVTKAMELDDSLAEAHVSLATLLQYHDFNWRDAQREFQRAIQLNPNLATAHQEYGDGLAMTGRLEEAIAEETRAQQLDPYSVFINAMRGGMLVFAGRNDEAIQQGRKMLDLDAGFAHAVLGSAYEQKGNSEQAISEFQQAVKLQKDHPLLPETMANLAHAYAVFGKKQEALRLLAELKEMSKRRFVPAWAFAIVYAVLGDKDKAFGWLDKAYDERPSDVMNIKVDPRMEPLRSDPRYQDLLLRMGLPR
jgi:serine/threonine protein kinase/tetratricopeptide (TPR) repeat protein